MRPEGLGIAAMGKDGRRGGVQRGDVKVSADLTAEPTSARLARRVVLDALGALDGGAEDVRFVVELLTSEVVSNVVLHTASAPHLEADVTPGRVRVAVYDEDPTLPIRREPDADRPGGHGLHLLDDLATRWGTETVGHHGKVVWFEVDLPGG